MILARFSDKERLDELKHKADVEKMKADIARKELSYREQINESKAIAKRLKKMRFNDSLAGKTINIIGSGFKDLGKSMKETAKKHKAKNKQGKKPKNIFENRSSQRQNKEKSFLDKAFGS